jgi:hypothetical protein
MANLSKDILNIGEDGERQHTLLYGDFQMNK